MAEEGDRLRFNETGVWHVDSWAMGFDASVGQWIKVTIAATGASNKAVATYEGETLGVSACCTAGFEEGDTTMIFLETDLSSWEGKTSAFLVGPWEPPPSSSA